MLREDKSKMHWFSDGIAFGKIEDLLIGRGDYRVTFRAEEGELESWLEHLATTGPREALPLLVKMLKIAVSNVLDEQSPKKSKP